jgi:hypothetical protein
MFLAGIVAPLASRKPLQPIKAGFVQIARGWGALLAAPGDSAFELKLSATGMKAAVRLGRPSVNVLF